MTIAGAGCKEGNWRERHCDICTAFWRRCCDSGSCGCGAGSGRLHYRRHSSARHGSIPTGLSPLTCPCTKIFVFFPQKETSGSVAFPTLRSIFLIPSSFSFFSHYLTSSFLLEPSCFSPFLNRKPFLLFLPATHQHIAEPS